MEDVVGDVELDHGQSRCVDDVVATTEILPGCRGKVALLVVADVNRRGGQAEQRRDDAPQPHLRLAARLVYGDYQPSNPYRRNSAPKQASRCPRTAFKSPK